MPLGIRQFSITLEGRRSQTIQILGISPELTEQPTPPLNGTVFDVPPQGVGDAQRIGFNLDEPARTAREVDEYTPPGFSEPYFASKVIKLPTYERESVVVIFKANRHAYSFKLKIEYLIGADHKTITVDDAGQPFRITGYHCEPSTKKVIYPTVYSYGLGVTNLVPADPYTHFAGVTCD